MCAHVARDAQEGDYVSPFAIPLRPYSAKEEEGLVFVEKHASFPQPGAECG